jgi:hypothetical protein
MTVVHLNNVKAYEYDKFNERWFFEKGGELSGASGRVAFQGRTSGAD